MRVFHAWSAGKMGQLVVPNKLTARDLALVVAFPSLAWAEASIAQANDPMNSFSNIMEGQAFVDKDGSLDNMD